MQKTRWTRKKLLAYSFIVCVLILLLTELIFRILFWSEIKGYNSTVFIQGNTIQMEDSSVVFRNRPFYLDYYRRFQYNEAGMRSKPADVWMPKKDSSDYWIFLFGGSAMEGMGSNKDGEWQDITGIGDYPWNENIAFYLQQLLQEKMPGKKVRVFNAANTSYTIEQSYLRYLQLSSLYRMDWVISMDGQNNPPSLAADETVLDFVRKDWQQNPAHKFPMKWILPLTRHSAFVNKLKQTIFHFKQQNRTQKNIDANYPRAEFWLNYSSPALHFKNIDDGTNRAVNSFYDQLIRFDSVLNVRNQNHLLLIQPHLIFRDEKLMNKTEKALLHYYRQAYNDSATNCYLQEIRNRFKTKVPNGDSTIQLMDPFDHISQQVFVDYCHFTREANQLIAENLMQYILKKEANAN